MSRQSNEVERRGQNWQTWNKQSDVLLEGDGHHEEATNSQVKTLIIPVDSGNLSNAPHLRF